MFKRLFKPLQRRSRVVDAESRPDRTPSCRPPFRHGGDSCGERSGRGGSASPAVRHRSKVLATRVAHARLCSRVRAERLEQLGIQTLGDLAYGDLKTLASEFEAPGRALRTLKRYRCAIRLSASVVDLSPADALVLCGIHRRHVATLAGQTAMAVRRDWQRFADSSVGATVLRGRPVPTVRRIRRWIDGARASALSMNV